ncbi:AAA family ATPase [Anabaena sp. UHCC 0451]|uniref:AAA family ATPase n=1 Tax=Anabaena sp. UHCC 0451 TaxID=2055235 RepID=UPI002B20214D|nr:AAA family ATPase [Anabaena sp. UHCC 0451]MEA5578743.1 AAA family ATPase [Anabaena sp. UHCC 0451]
MLLSEHLNSSNLKSFSINGLFGYKDVKIPFDKEAVILIAENGSGKTTILNALYYSISCKFSKLITIDFESVVIEFTSGDIVDIKKSDLRYSSISDRNSSKKPNYKPAERTLNIINNITEYEYAMNINVNKQLELFRNVVDLDEEAIKQKIITPIEKNLNESILYFPTYRRIEEELKNFGNEELNFDKEDERLIQFGMDDVIAKFDEIEKNIKDATLELLPKVNGEMLTQFVEVTTPTQEMRDSIQPETLNIVLSRIGNNIPENDKNKIEELVNSGKIKAPQYDQLVYYLSKLLGLYEPQKEKDNSIKKFAEVCNKYLHKKRIVYDETSVKISIEQERNNQPIDMKNLSSGEKQIISLFSKIYLDSDDEYIILFDEPELSLSLEWQRFLLPDILKSGKCKLLLAVTHSPFIFDNELDVNAIDLDNFVIEK